MANSSGASEMHVNNERVQSTLEQLQCPVCYKTMTSKIFLCSNGHNVCSDCKTNISRCPTCRAEYSGARNFLVEQLLKCLEYPCENFDEGCQEKLTIENATKHKLTCLYRKYSCFSREKVSCQWRGRYVDIQPHIEKEHKNSLSSSKEILFCDKNYSNISSGSNDYFFIKRYDDMFVYYYNRMPDTGKMYFVVQYIGPADYAAQYQYKLSFADENKGKEMIIRYDVHTDSETVEEIHKSRKCAILNNEMAKQFLRFDNTLQYFLSIVKKRL